MRLELDDFELTNGAKFDRLTLNLGENPRNPEELIQLLKETFGLESDEQ